MGKFRLDALANLARQLEFTPLDTRADQLGSAEFLLHDLDSEKAYPLDFVIYRITGYQPQYKYGSDGSVANAELLTGLALQHDLGLLIEQVSNGLDLQASDAVEPVLSIEDVTERFSVTSKPSSAGVAKACRPGDSPLPMANGGSVSSSPAWNDSLPPIAISWDRPRSARWCRMMNRQPSFATPDGWRVNAVAV